MYQVGKVDNEGGLRNERVLWVIGCRRLTGESDCKIVPVDLTRTTYSLYT
jgi:hypothetical protein